MKTILVTAAGSIGAINYVRALRKEMQVRIVGTDYYPLNAEMNSLDTFYKSPKHHTHDYPALINRLVQTENADFVHPSIENEARVIAIHGNPETLSKTYLPKLETSGLCLSKTEVCNTLSKQCLAKPALYYSKIKDNLEGVFKMFGSPVWVRLQTGAGGRGSLACKTPETIHTWIKLITTLGKGKEKDFIIQPYLKGNDYSFVSLWFNGNLLTSFSKQRLSYLFPHLSLSGITGTPTVSQIVHDCRVNETGVKAILAIDNEPHGIFCVDLKEDDGEVYVTEINCKPQTTMFLWSYVASCMGCKQHNLAAYYTQTGIAKAFPYELPKYDLYPDDWLLLRHVDVGVKLVTKHGKVTVPLG
jgi:glutathione synthase/RimK-type ligase-like ATP-grasp enzyme